LDNLSYVLVSFEFIHYDVKYRNRVGEKEEV
jgi:hypothetical protein